MGHGRRWRTGLLIKGLIAARVSGGGGASCYLAFTRQMGRSRRWKRLLHVSGMLDCPGDRGSVACAGHFAQSPYFDLTMHSGPGEYHGFFWFYFINEHVLRFLNMRYPRDYNTVPRLYFWLFHLLWLFPWSVYFPACGVVFSAYRSRQPRCDCWPLLGRLPPDLLHLFHHPGILLHAMLSGAGAAAGQRPRGGRRMGPHRGRSCSRSSPLLRRGQDRDSFQ